VRKKLPLSKERRLLAEKKSEKKDQIGSKLEKVPRKKTQKRGEAEKAKGGTWYHGKGLLNRKGLFGRNMWENPAGVEGGSGERGGKWSGCFSGEGSMLFYVGGSSINQKNRPPWIGT